MPSVMHVGGIEMRRLILLKLSYIMAENNVNVIANVIYHIY